MPELAGESSNPSFLAIHPSGRFLYTVNEISKFNGKSSGAVSAFAVDQQTGKLTFLNQEPSEGPGPCYLIVDKKGEHVLVANYDGGSVAVLPISPDGKVGAATGFVQHHGSSVNPDRQKEPHAHSINLDADNKFAIVADLGLDDVIVYKFDSVKGRLAPNDPPFAQVKPGSGPRHFAFDPKGRYGYVISEMLCTVTTFKYDGKVGDLDPVQVVSTLPPGEAVKPAYSTAEVRVHPSGKFLYGSNRGHNSIVAYKVDPTSGELTYLENESTQGKTPRNFAISPSGKWLLAENQDSDSIVVFKIDNETGKLEPAGQTVTVGAPVCIKFLQP
jgi:6-phosphogluconolactonase